LLHGFTAGFALAVVVGVAASVGGAGGLLLHGFTFAAVLALGVGVGVSVGATAGPLAQGLGLPVTVADGDASGAFLPWLQPASARAKAMAPANCFKVCSSTSRP
jgi:hypothetical protein